MTAARKFASGVTLVELIVVMLVVAVLGAVVVPRFLGSSAFHDLGFADETRSILRYAQRSALAMQRTVCVSFTGQSVTLTYAAAYGTSVCDTALPGPSGEAGPYQIAGRGSASFSPVPAGFNYDRQGRPSAGQVIAIAGGPTILVETDTGYVH